MLGPLQLIRINIICYVMNTRTYNDYIFNVIIIVIKEIPPRMNSTMYPTTEKNVEGASLV